MSFRVAEEKAKKARQEGRRSLHAKRKKDMADSLHVEGLAV